MAATVDIREKNGAGETPTTKTSGQIRFKAADDANVDLNNPIVRPGSPPPVYAYSYEKVLRMYLGGTGPTGAITSIRAFSDTVNGFGTGVTMFAGTNAAYVQPVVTDSTLATTDFFTYSSGSPLSMGAGPYDGTTPGLNSDMGDYLYLQADVANTASPGLTPSETLTISYDET